MIYVDIRDAKHVYTAYCGTIIKIKVAAWQFLMFPMANHNGTSFYSNSMTPGICDSKAVILSKLIFKIFMK